MGLESSHCTPESPESVASKLTAQWCVCAEKSEAGDSTRTRGWKGVLRNSQCILKPSKVMENGTCVCGIQGKGAAKVIERVDQRREKVGRKPAAAMVALREVNICSRGGKKTFKTL